MLEHEFHSCSYVYNYIKTLLKHTTVWSNVVKYSLYKLFILVANHVATVYSVVS